MSISISDRFWNKVSKNSECWLWGAAKYSNGYGAFRIGKKQTTAHRVAYILSYGEIPESLVVCHSCDNRLCVNPAHLFIGTQQDNIDDMVGKGRQATGNKLQHKSQVGSLNNGAKLTESLVLEIRKLFGEGMSQAKISKKLRISRLNIWNIVHRKSWTHI